MTSQLHECPKLATLTSPLHAQIWCPQTTRADDDSTAEKPLPKWGSFITPITSDYLRLVPRDTPFPSLLRMHDLPSCSLGHIIQKMSPSPNKTGSVSCLLHSGEKNSLQILSNRARQTISARGGRNVWQLCPETSPSLLYTH